jgi:hypothetical protein
MVAAFSSAVGDDWREEAEALRLQEIDNPKKVLQRRHVTQIHPDGEKTSNCSTGRFLGVAVVGLVVALCSRERKTLSGTYSPWKRIRSFFGGLIPSAGSGRGTTPNVEWKKKKPSVMAAEAAEARHGGKKKKKKKKKRSH